MQWYPKKVVFIDDSIGYLESVEQVLNEMGIDFIGFHYMEGEELPCTLDNKVAEFQFRYFAENVKWLSDDQAKEMMKNKKPS